MTMQIGPVELRCPRDHSALEQDGAVVRCAEGHEYRVKSEIPVLLLDDTTPTHPVIDRSLEMEEANIHSGPGPDPFVQEAIKATCGNLYQPMFDEGIKE